MPDSNTMIYLHSQNGNIVDDCGNTWNAVGSPSVSNDGISLGASSRLELVGGITIGGADFTVDFWSNVSSSSGEYAHVFTFFNARNTVTDFIGLFKYSTGTKLGYCGFGSKKSVTCDWLDKKHHFALVYRQEQKRSYIYIDGLYIDYWTGEITEKTYTNLWLSGSSYDSETSAIQVIDKFRVSDIARWTDSFFPEGLAPELAEGFTYLDSSHYIWYNPGKPSLFEKKNPDPYFITAGDTYSNHYFAIEFGHYRYGEIGIPSDYRTNETYISFNVYHGTSELALLVAKNDTRILYGGDTLTDFNGGTASLGSGLHNIAIHFINGSFFEWYIDGVKIAEYASSSSSSNEYFRFQTTDVLRESSLSHSNFISDIIITNDSTTGQKLISNPDSVIDGDAPKITESSRADITIAIKMEESSHADVYRRVASGGYADISRTAKLNETARTDIERTVRDNRKITESAYTDLSRTVEVEESAYADIERIVKATATEDGYADLSRTVKLEETGCGEIERKIPYRVRRENGKMFLGNYPVISVEVNLSESTLSDSVGYQIYGEMFPKDALVGNLLDYNIDMEIESTSQQKGVQSCESVYKMDEIMFRTIRYANLGANTLSSVHIARAANAMGLTPVLRYEDFTPENDYSGSDITYKNLLSGMFGWTQDLPWRNINIFIRDGNLYATQRGMEPNTIDISTIPHDHPQINRTVMREYEGVTVTQGATGVKSGNVFTKFTGYIYNGDFRAWYSNGLCVEQRQGDDITRNEYDANTEQLKRSETIHADGGKTITEYSHGYSITGQVVETTEKHTTIDKDGNREVTTTYNNSMGNGMTSSITFSGSTYIGQSHGHGSVSGTAYDYLKKQANIALGAKPEAGTVVEWENQWPIKDGWLINKIFNELLQYDRKIQETVSVELTPIVSHGTIAMNHIIDFNDKIILDGKEYFLVSNVARLDPRKFSQSLQLVRWF